MIRVLSKRKEKKLTQYIQPDLLLHERGFESTRILQVKFMPDYFTKTRFASESSLYHDGEYALNLKLSRAGYASTEFERIETWPTRMFIVHIELLNVFMILKTAASLCVG